MLNNLFIVKGIPKNMGFPEMTPKGQRNHKHFVTVNIHEQNDFLSFSSIVFNLSIKHTQKKNN